MTGALNFTLGLQANQFLNSLGVASGKLVGFLGVANGIQMAFHKMWGAIQTGGKLNDLAASANITVKQLYQLQRAFDEVGASADSVPAVVNKLRRTLGSGEQNNLLSGIGLDPAKLGRMDPAKQFEAIAASLSRLDVNARSNAAQKLFGREGAATAMQIANSGKDFAEAMKAAESDAEIWSRVAKTFDDIGDKVIRITKRVEAMWALIAGAFVQAFKEGRIAEILFDIFNTVFSAIGAALPELLMGGLVKIGETLLRVLQVPMAWLQTTLDLAAQGLFVTISKIPGLRDALGIPSNFQPEHWSDIHKRNQENGSSFFGASLDDMSKYAADKFGAAGQAAGPLFAALQGRLEALVGRLPQSQIAAIAGGGGGVGGGVAKNIEATSIEKMGFIFNGRGSTTDYARNTAENTRQLVRLGQETNKLLARNEAGDFTNQ